MWVSVVRVKHCAIALSTLALYGRPDKQLEMTIHKMYCGSVWMWVRRCGSGWRSGLVWVREMRAKLCVTHEAWLWARLRVVGGASS